MCTLVLHPGMRLKFFENEAIWGDLIHRGRILVEHLFETYKSERPSDDLPADRQAARPKLQASWSDQLLQMGLTISGASLDDELTRFFGNVYAYKPGMNVLQWWKVCLFRIYLLTYIIFTSVM
jgi:hypothetical protein